MKDYSEDILKIQEAGRKLPELIMKDRQMALAFLSQNINHETCNTANRYIVPDDIVRLVANRPKPMADRKSRRCNRWCDFCGNWRSSGHSGMTLRDYFAARAMEALLSRLQRPLCPQDCIVVAEDAYFMADHMLKAREAK